MEIQGGTSTDTATNVAPPPAAGAEDQKTAAVNVGNDTQPGATEDNAAAEETTEQKQARQQSRFQRRLDRQKEARIRAEVERDYYREQAQKLEAQRQAPKGDAEPRREDYGSDTEYLNAHIDWRAEKVAEAKLKARDEAGKAREAQFQASKSQEEVARKWETAEREYSKGAKDYAEAVGSFLQSDEFGQFDKGARQAIVETDKGPAILHHLATHPEDAERIADLSPKQQEREIWRLEEKLATARKPSGAPDPVKPLGSGRAGTKDPTKMSDQEYREYRKAQGARWAQ